MNTVDDPMLGLNAKSRAEQKALDREVPWRAIANQPTEVVSTYHEAIENNLSKWRKYSPVKPLSYV